MIINASTQLLVSLPYKILNNASKRNALTNGLPAKKILNANQLLMIATRNADLKHPAGNSVFQEKVVKPLLMLQNVPKQIIASDLNWSNL